MLFGDQKANLEDFRERKERKVQMAAILMSMGLENLHRQFVQRNVLERDTFANEEWPS